MSRDEKPWNNLIDLWSEIDDQGNKQQVDAESSTQPKVYGSRKNSCSSYEDQNETCCKAIGSERPSSKASREDSGYSYESWADRSFPSTEDRAEDSDNPSETYYDVVEHVESERESLSVCQAALSSVSNNCQLGNREWLQEGFANKSKNAKDDVTNGKKTLPRNSGTFPYSENATSETSDNKIKNDDVCQAGLSSVFNNCQLENREWLQEGLTNKSKNAKGNVTNGKKTLPRNSGTFPYSENAETKDTSDNKIKNAGGERVYHCPSNVPKGKPMSLNGHQNAAELENKSQTNNNFKYETVGRQKQDKDMVNNQLASHKLNPNERYRQETLYDRNETQQRRNFSRSNIHEYCRSNEEPEYRIQRIKPNRTTDTKRNEREHMKTGIQYNVYGSRRKNATTRQPNRDNRDYFKNNAVENEDDCAGNIQWKNTICDEFENYGFRRGNKYVPLNRNNRIFISKKNVNWQNNQPGRKSGYQSEGYVEDRHQNRSSSFPTENKKIFNEHDRNYDETMRSRSPRIVHHVVKHEVKVIHVNRRKGYRSKHRDNVPESDDTQKLKHKQEERKAPPNGMDNFTWSIINLKKQLNSLEEKNVATATAKNFATAEEKNIATANEKKNVAEKGRNNTVEDYNIFQTDKVEVQQKPKIYSVWNSTSENGDVCSGEKRQNKCDTKNNSEFQIYYHEKVDEEYGNHVPTNKKNALAKKQLLINYGKEISNLVAGCHTAMQVYLSLYHKEWIHARHQSIKLLDGLIKDVTENAKGGRMQDFFHYIGITAKIVTVVPAAAQYGQIANVVAAISDMLSKYFGSSPMELDQRRREMLRSFQLDDDVSEELYMHGLQCDFQMMDTRKFIEEFHHAVVEREYSDIELQQGLRKFLREIAGFDPEHPSFTRQFYAALWGLRDQCPGSDNDVYRAFCSGFDDGPEQMGAMKFLNWRCCVDTSADGALIKSWEEISLLLQSTTPSNKADLLKRLEDCSRVLMKEERVYQKVFQSLDEYK